MSPLQPWHVAVSRPDVSKVCQHVICMGGAVMSVVRLFISSLVRSSGPLAGMDWASGSDTASVGQLCIATARAFIKRSRMIRTLKDWALQRWKLIFITHPLYSCVASF